MPYNTLDKTFLNHFKYYPLDLKKRRRQEIGSMIAQIICMMSVAALIVGIYFLFETHVQWNRALLAVIELSLAWYIFLISQGRPNYINYSQAGALTLAVECAISLKKEKMAFVFCDYSRSVQGRWIWTGIFL